MKKLVFVVILAAMMSVIAPAAQADPRPFAPYLWAREMATPFFKIEMGVDSQIGQILEGLVIEPEMIGDENRVFWVYPGTSQHYWLRLSDLVGDPRETEWWQENIYTTSAKSLKGMVEALAKTKDNPEVTEAILANIVGRGHASKSEIGRDLSLERIRQIIAAYTAEIEVAVF